MGKRALELELLRDRELELQRVFDAWPLGISGTPTVHVDNHDYVVAGRPHWLAPHKRSELSKQLVADLGYAFRPDVVWEAETELLVIELKWAPKYEPLALPEVLHHAHVLERRESEHVIIPVMVTQYSMWLREALDFLFEKGLSREALRYVEFQALGSRAASSRRFLWLDEPFAPWKRATPPESVVSCARDVVAWGRTAEHWYRIEATDTWVATREAPQGDARPLVIEGPYCMFASAGGGAFLSWSGAQNEQGRYYLHEDEFAPVRARLATPRLAHPEELGDFEMEILEPVSGDA